MLTFETIETFLAVQKTILLLTLLVNIWSLIALYKNSRNRPSDYGLALMLLGLFGWTASILTLLLFASLPAAHLAFFSTTVAFTGFAWFAIVYSNEHYRKIDIIYLIPGIIVAIASLIPGYFINGLEVNSFGYLTLLRNSALAGFSVYALLAGIIPTAILLYKKYYEQNIQTRQRLHWIAMASLITFGGSFITNVFLPNFLNFPYLNSVGPTFSMILGTIIVWVTSREHYVDSHNIFSIITGRLALVAATILIFASVAMLLIVGRTPATIVHIVSGIATAIAIFILGPNIRYFGEAILQGKDRRNRDGTCDTGGLAEALAHTTTREEIIPILGNFLVENIGIDKFQLILAEQSEPSTAIHAAALAEIRACLSNPPSLYIIDALPLSLPNIENAHKKAVYALASALHADAIVPVSHKHQIIGIIALSKKRNKKGYTRGDAQLLSACSRILSPLLIRATIIEHADEMTHILEETVVRRTNAIIQKQEEERDIFYNLANKITKPLEALESALLNNSEAQNSPEFLAESLQELSKIAKGLTAYARAKSSTYIPNRYFNLSTITNELIKSAKRVADDNEIALRYDIKEDIFCSGSATSIHNAFANIVENAFRYIGNEKKEVVMTLEANDDQAIFTVADSGIGIPKDLLSRTGTPFFHAHPKESEEQGIGLGLTIAKSIIDKHGGSLLISSLFGKGTTVRIALPLAKENKKTA